jgi:thioredoxin 1
MEEEDKLYRREEPVPIINERNFTEFLTTHNQAIVLIYASWCPFCIRFLPVFTKYAPKMEAQCFMVKDDQEIIADQYAVEVVPTVLFFENGQVSKRLDGILGVGLKEKQLAEFIGDCNQYFQLYGN